MRLPSLARRCDFAAVVRHLDECIAPGIARTDAAVVMLSRLPWPGNVLELHTVLQRVVMHSADGYIGEDTFADAANASVDCCAEYRGHALR